MWSKKVINHHAIMNSKFMRQIKYFHWIILFFIFGMGLFLRLDQPTHLVWAEAGYDLQRDVIVSSHFEKYGEFLSRGPYAVGGLNWLQNPPIYFYFTTAIWILTNGNMLAYTVAFLLILSLEIPAAYMVGSRLWDRKTGYLAALFMATNAQLVYESRHFIQPFTIPLFVLLLLLTFTYKVSVKNMCFSILCLLLPLFFHYGILLFFPIGIWWIISNWIKLYEENKNPLWKLCIPVLLVVLLSLIWIFTSYTLHPFDQLFIFFFNFSGHHLNILSQFIKADQNLFRFIFQKATFLTILVSAILFGLMTLWPKISGQEKNYLPVFYILLSFCFSFLFASFFGGVLLDTYLVGFIPIVLIVFALGVRVVLQKNVLIGFCLALFIALTFYRETRTSLGWNITAESNYDQAQHIADAIFSDYQKNTRVADLQKQPDLGVILLITHSTIPFDGWGTSGFWYLLEGKFNRKLVILTNGGANFLPIINNPKLLYLICDRRVQPELAPTECLQRFIRARTYLLPDYQQVSESETYSVWRFRTRLKETDPEGSARYTAVYPEMMVSE